MAKVLLIQPNRDLKSKSEEKYVLPSSLLWVATAIEHKHPVEIYDRNVRGRDEDFFNFLEEYKPDIVGFTAMTSSMLLDIVHLGPLIKKQNKRIIILVGGLHASSEPDSVLSEPYVDYILQGEGEEAFLEFCDTFDKNPKKIGGLKNINKNPRRPFADINQLKFPNYELVDLEKYSELIFISTSRGCPGRCTFCFNIPMWGKDGNPCIRFHDIEKVKELFREIIGKYGITDFTIADENFMSSKKRCIEICKFLEQEYKGKIGFYVFGRADFVDKEVITALKKAGCHTIELGSESGSQRILDYLNKRISVEQQGKAIEICKESGIVNDASFMIGIPTETMEELKMTEKFIRKYKPEIANVHIFNPLPGSSLMDELVKEGKIKKPTTLKNWAEWTGNLKIIKHNFSEIPDDILLESAKRLFKLNYYKTRIRKALYWAKRGKFKYLLSRIKSTLLVNYGSEDWS